MQDITKESQVYDFAIIGGGIIGMSVAMQLKEKLPDASVVVLDKENGLAEHQTGHNSGVIHAGVYYTPNTLKARFCYEGNRLTREFCDNNGIKYDICGKLLVATNELEMERMEALWTRTEANGLERYRLDAAQLREREPNIVGLGGIYFPSSGIVSYREVTRVMGRRFEEKGGKICLGAEVFELGEYSDHVQIKTTRGRFAARYLISCPGLMSDRVVKMLGIEPDFVICPFRGEYYRLAPKYNQVVKHLIYPVPDPSMPFLGVHLTRMIDGSVTVGPNAVLAFIREGYKKTDMCFLEMAQMAAHPGIRKVLRTHFRAGLSEMKNSLFKSGYLKLVNKYCPVIKKDDLLPYPAGVRAQAVSNDGRLIEDFIFVKTRRSVNVCNAPSPAATSALPIGRHILEQVDEMIAQSSSQAV